MCKKAVHLHIINGSVNLAQFFINIIFKLLILLALIAFWPKCRPIFTFLWFTHLYMIKQSSLLESSPVGSPFLNCIIPTIGNFLFALLIGCQSVLMSVLVLKIPWGFLCFGSRQINPFEEKHDQKWQPCTLGHRITLHSWS